MSSRIISGRDSSVEPVQWRIPELAAATLHSHGDEPSGQTSGSPPVQEEIEALRARVQQLEQELPVRENQARQAGHREGEAAAAARWEQAIERMTRTCSEVASYRGRLRREAEQDVVKLSLAIARRILRRELHMDPEAILGLVRVAFDRLDLRELNRIRVRPEDVAAVRGYLDRIGGSHEVSVVPDPGMEKGGAILECQRGEVDVSLETQLEEIERGFADMLGRKDE